MNSAAVPTVIHEDNHIIVIDKPPLLATMGVSENEDSLVKWTKNWIREKYDKPGNVFLGVVSRLDSFTCGLIVFARTSKAAGRLTRQFQEGKVTKHYLAVLEDRLETGEPWSGSKGDRLVDWLKKDDGRRRMVVVPPNTEGAKRAELTYQVLGWHQQQTLVRVQLLTGRKHQIRAQFSSRGAPVLGDRKYDGNGDFRPGIALQSSSLVFEHPVKHIEMNFQVEPPKRWNLGRFGSS